MRSFHLIFRSSSASLTAMQMLGTPVMPLKRHPKDVEKGFCPEVPAAFISLEQSRNSLDYHWNGCINFLNKLENDNWYPKSTGIGIQEPLDALMTSEEVRQAFFDVFERWLVAFQAFLQIYGKLLDGKGLKAARTLEISHSLAMIFLNVSTVNVFKDETAWDRFTEHYEHVVNLAGLIIKSSTCDKFTEKRGPEFTLDMNIVSPLYAVARTYISDFFSPVSFPH